ncbi:Protein MANNAN SYNTHESIS-RELATED 1 [Heracleum sosnowskyi]|uniref:O-fucosyltransferase family protein n=1 Tax=Heracleum sosnowskyi TaxID=360622 RepID=A0AAD8N838_9APIA|nr:Protein MANNAN SYNTHESIS-RELATED 1 [Heracleum sosnowskyi]
MALVDVRQLVAGMLTFSMFIMLENMIRKDHFGTAIVDDVNSASAVSNIDTQKNWGEDLIPYIGPWRVNNETVKPCWIKPAQESWNQQKGYILFSLTGGPHLHLLQVANAVVIARQLKATLVLPVIVGNKSEKKWKFGDVYDVRHFIASLNGIVEITYHQPAELSAEKLPIVRVPNLVSEDYVTAQIEPLFKSKRNLKLVTYFRDLNNTTIEGKKHKNSISCMVVFEALQLQAGLHELVNSVLEKLISLSKASHGRFIAVDLRTEMKGAEICQVTAADGKKSCFSAMEVGKFLNKIGFERNTTIYLTEDGLHKSQHELINIFLSTFTKDVLIPSDKMAKFSDYSDVIDYHICSHSDVFVPAFSRPFYASVVGVRIALGKTQILDPSQATSSNVRDYISSYVTRKNHWAYSCFC